MMHATGFSPPGTGNNYSSSGTNSTPVDIKNAAAAAPGQPSVINLTDDMQSVASSGRAERAEIAAYALRLEKEFELLKVQEEAANAQAKSNNGSIRGLSRQASPTPSVNNRSTSGIRAGFGIETEVETPYQAEWRDQEEIQPSEFRYVPPTEGSDIIFGVETL